PGEIETTLIVHPRCLTRFDDYNDFLDEVDGLLELRELDGAVQVASFHPDYRFVDSPVDDPANYTNPSPYPMLHFLRESSVSRAGDSHPDLQAVPAATSAELRALALAQLRERVVLDES